MTNRRSFFKMLGAAAAVEPVRRVQHPCESPRFDLVIDRVFRDQHIANEALNRWIPISAKLALFKEKNPWVLAERLDLKRFAESGARI